MLRLALIEAHVYVNADTRDFKSTLASHVDAHVQNSEINLQDECWGRIAYEAALALSDILEGLRRQAPAGETVLKGLLLINCKRGRHRSVMMSKVTVWAVRRRPCKNHFNHFGDAAWPLGCVRHVLHLTPTAGPTQLDRMPPWLLSTCRPSSCHRTSSHA